MSAPGLALVLALALCFAAADGLAQAPAEVQQRSGVPSQPVDSRQMVGGPCEYASYPGKATIVSVMPRPLQPGELNLGYRPLVVTFSFEPGAPIPKGPLVPGRMHKLTLTDGRDPGPKFLAKYGIRQGASLPCQLRIITKGTCTPVLFFFPGIDTSDYEAERLTKK